MLDLVIVGAGHAGLAASQVAAAAGLEHLVLERGEIGQSWRTQRWDSFTMNTPNAMNRLPGSPYRGPAPEAFESRDAWVERLGGYVTEHALPVRSRTTVNSVEQRDGGFVITTDQDRHSARTVIVASGISNAPKAPATAAAMDTLSWLCETGWMDQRPADLPDPAMQRWANPQISGVGPLGHTVSLQGLAARGVTLLGRFESADGPRARFASDLPQNVAFADAVSQRLRQHVDEHIAPTGARRAADRSGSRGCAGRGSGQLQRADGARSAGPRHPVRGLLHRLQRRLWLAAGAGAR